LLADNQKKNNEIIASGKAEVEALKAKVLGMEEKCMITLRTIRCAVARAACDVLNNALGINYFNVDT
jgi:hypothetical protein